ncbi:MAG: hypothetical protein GY757_19080 [bacterium]|nr:hypothetical protein [bacterium]
MPKRCKCGEEDWAFIGTETNPTMDIFCCECGTQYKISNLIDSAHAYKAAVRMGRVVRRQEAVEKIAGDLSF